MSSLRFRLTSILVSHSRLKRASLFSCFYRTIMSTVMKAIPVVIHISLINRFRLFLLSNPSSASLVTAISPILALQALGVPRIRSLIGRLRGLSSDAPGWQSGKVDAGAVATVLELVGKITSCATAKIVDIAPFSPSKGAVVGVPGICKGL